MIPSERSIAVWDVELAMLTCCVNVFWLSIALAAGISGAAEAPLRFEADVLPILESRCSECHGSDAAESGLIVTSRDKLLQGGDSGPALVRGQSERSLLFNKVFDGEMPPDDPLPEAEVDAIRRWIDEGALVDGETVANGEHSADPYLESEVLVKIFFTHCISCHGKSRQEAGLDLRTRDSMIRGGKSGTALVPGDPEASLVYRRLVADEMPPKVSVLGDDNYVRRVGPDELALLSKWIGGGAPASPPSPGDDAHVRASAREHWSFRPPQRFDVPRVAHADQVRNPIDAFVLSKLESRGLELSAEASKVELVRRAFFDLLGLPPTPDEVSEFLRDSRPDAYDRLIDRLLESPRYGERWAQHWLDGAGYSDSHGKIDRDQFRPYIWRYRDYVIRALNADKPYDQFLCEQIAGDELVAEAGDAMPPKAQVDALVATGFLLTASDATDEAAFNFIPNRMGVVAEQLDILSTSVMAVTMECARCHTHKFDPITQRDYYRWSAIFQAALDPYDWRIVSQTLYPKRIPLDRSHQRYIYHSADIEPIEIRRVNQPLRARLQLLESQIANQAEQTREKLQRSSTVASPLQDPAGATVATSSGSGVGAAADANPRPEPVAALVANFADLSLEELAERDADFKKNLEASRAEITRVRAELIEPLAIHGLQDLGGEPTPVFQLRRGEPQSPGLRVAPGVPSAFEEFIEPYRPVAIAGAKTSGYRLGFARWLVQPQHPLTARVIVNRIWQHHFGVALAPTPANFGAKGLRPTHPELLDWLATELTRERWSLKSIHRLIMTSSVYRQTSRGDDQRQAIDPDNILYSRFFLQRLDAEALRDAMLLASGQLDVTPFGPPDGVSRSPIGEVLSSQPAGPQRRSIYLAKMRLKPLTFLEQFDGAEMTPNCLERSKSTVPTQAFALLNSEFTDQCAAALASLSLSDAGPASEMRLTRIYLRLFGRQPTSAELTSSLDAIQQVRAAWVEELQRHPEDARDPEVLAWQSFCRIAFNSPEFLYVD